MVAEIFEVTTWVVLGLIVCGFILSRLLNRNDVADGLWGLGFLAIGWSQFWVVGQWNLRSALVMALLTAWAIRLSVYLWVRLLPKPEDVRYRNWRKNWGKSEATSAFFKVFVLQGALLGVASLPISLVVRAPMVKIQASDFLALVFVLVGILFEWTADWQLSQFRKDKKNRGALLTEGVWGLCRHPNYFGEILIWWGFFLFAVPLQGGWLALASPILMTFLLVWVSGVPMLEALLAKKGAAFKKYVQSTPALIPFRLTKIVEFFLLGGILLGLDSIWLGGIMKRFYLEQPDGLFLKNADGWDPIVWAVVAVYAFISVGIQFFALSGARSLPIVFFRGSVFGLVVYGVYETTNLALVQGWPIEMALVDILWGPILCGMAAVFTQQFVWVFFRQKGVRGRP